MVAGLQDIDLRGLADDLGSGLPSLYTGIYRVLSEDAHPSVASVQHHVILSREGRIAGIRGGPDYEQLADTLALAVCSLLLALEGFLERFGTPEESQEQRALVDAYRLLLEDDDRKP